MKPDYRNWMPRSMVVGNAMDGAFRIGRSDREDKNG